MNLAMVNKAGKKKKVNDTFAGTHMLSLVLRNLLSPQRISSNADKHMKIKTQNL